MVPAFQIPRRRGIGRIHPLRDRSVGPTPTDGWRLSDRMALSDGTRWNSLQPSVVASGQSQLAAALLGPLRISPPDYLVCTCLNEQLCTSESECRSFVAASHYSSECSSILCLRRTYLSERFA